MSGEEENVETVPQEEQKVEETPQEGETTQQNNEEAQNSDANDNYAHSADEKEAYQEGEAPRRRKVKRYRKKAQKLDWNLTNNNHLPVNHYNALKDQHLQSFFVNDRVRKHLRKMYLITKEGYIVEKPDEYRRNKNLLKMHYASQSPKKTTGKTKKTKVVDKSEHEQFIEDVKKEYGAQDDQNQAESNQQGEEAPPQEEAPAEE